MNPDTCGPIMPPNIPCTTRAAMSTPAVGASPTAALATTNPSIAT